MMFRYALTVEVTSSTKRNPGIHYTNFSGIIKSIRIY